MVLMSIFSKTSTQGMMKNTPGPRAPPVSRRPRRKITALSYSLFVVFISCTNVPFSKILLWYSGKSHLDNFDNYIEGKWERGKDEEQGSDCEKERTDSWTLLANWEYVRHQIVNNGSVTDCKIGPYLNIEQWLCMSFETGTLTHLFHPGPCLPRFPSWTTSCRSPSSSTYHVFPRPRWHLKGQEVIKSFQVIPRYWSS